jgi:tetratricopeptide (TPR) repeat protein
VKKQLILTVGGLILIAILFFFGRTVVPRSKEDAKAVSATKAFNINQFIAESKQHLSPSQAIHIGELENSVSRGDVLTQQIGANTRLASFWKDSLHVFEPYAFYLSEAAKLDKSEKNLTFAAQLFLDNLRGEADEAKLNWKAEQAIALFEKALALNPGNDDLKIGLASCYVFGKGRIGGPAETMKGISQLLEVVRRDSLNMKAQLVLGIGGFVSGQYDKATERLLKVIKAEPDNLEAIAFLADTYAARGQKEEAIKWYLVSKRMANDPHYSQEVDDRIRQLR